MATVDKDVLSRAINTSLRAVGANPIFPLLSNVLFESKNGESRISGTNLEIGIGCTFPSSGGEEFRACVPAKVFVSLVDAINTGEIDLEFDPSNQSMMVMTDSSTSSIRCAPPEEFPDIPQVEHPSFALPVIQFKEMIQRVAFCANMDGQSALSAVQLSIEGKKLIMFAVDGFHLSYEETPLTRKGSAENILFLVKGSTLEIISRTLPEDGILEVQVEPNKAMFHCGNVDVVTQLMSGGFPDHKLLKEAVPPPTTILTISTMDLLRSARQVRVFAVETGNSRLEVKGMLVRYSAVAQEKGDADVTFMAVRQGEDVAVGLSVHKLYEFLEVCKAEQVIIEISGSTSPILFKLKELEGFYHVIMPIGP